MHITPRRIRRKSTLAVVAALVAAGTLTAPTLPAAGVVGDRVTFSNAAPIHLGPARGSRFVSSLQVVNQPTKIEDVNVTLRGFHAPNSADVDVLLESPSGTRVMIMSDAIGISNGCVLDSGTYDLTFDDAAPDRMYPPWRSGTFKPSNFSTCDGGDNFVPLAHGNSLSLYNGEDPNGTWKLYLADDSDYFQSTIDELKGGWSLDIGYPLPPIASGDLQIQGPGGSAFHNFRTCAVTRDGGTLKYPIKIINTGNQTAQFRLKTESPAKLYARPSATTALPQDNLGYLTPQLAPGATVTYIAKIKLPAGAGPSSAHAEVRISDTNGTKLDEVAACAVEAAGASSTSSELLLKAGNGKQVSGSHAVGVTGKTLIPDGASATFVATLKNRTKAPKRMSFSLDGDVVAESPYCDNIAVTIKEGRVDVTSQALNGPRR